MSDRIPDEWHRLFSAALDDTITEAESAQLAVLLKTNAEARQLWFLYHDNECGLAELKPRATIATTATPGRNGRFAWRPLTAAAAGLVFGLFSASMVWGYVGLRANQATTLLAESFEAGPAPKVIGMPVHPGMWSGDFSEVVGEFPGVKPAQGGKMLRFLRADYEGKPVRDGYVADLFRIIDLRGKDLAVSGGEVSIQLDARFAALPQNGLQGMSCGMTIYALDALPPDGTRDDAFLKRMAAGLQEAAEPDAEPHILATATRSEKAETTGHWQTVRSELRLPAETRYCLIHLRAHLNGSHRPEIAKPVEFAGLFLDDIHLTLTQRATRP